MSVFALPTSLPRLHPRPATDPPPPPQIGDQIIYCVLDGDGCLFHRSLVAKGRDGGREAARALINHLDDYAASKGVRGQLTIVVHLYLNKAGLAKVYQVRQPAHQPERPLRVSTERASSCARD